MSRRIHVMKPMQGAARMSLLGTALALATPAALAAGQEGPNQAPETAEHCGKGGGPDRPGGAKWRRMADELELTDAQRSQVRSIFQDARSQRRKLRGLPGGERRPQMRELRRETRRRVAEVLTPEQRQQAQSLRRRHREARMERRLNRMDRRLELTDEQVDIIRDTVERARARKRQLREQAKPSDVTRTRMRRIHERMRNEIREVLTPEQRQRLAEVRARPHHGPRPGH